ncbi:MAG: hypothetical protein HUJ77_12460 [Clostridium sp.]|uniref:hypothetical protein n=1 Tax=Clostridium sp. TaxID=1506 RepID=UPI0025BBEEDA|nr:hypothetical protein [Clostridium sp.]MCF0149195.1 hypothetical protein [Clostridium sp.]
MKRLLIIFFSLSLIFTLTSCSNSSAKVVREYTGSASFGDNEAYALGENSEGIPIFKDTDKAFSQALMDYKDGFKAIEEQYDLNPVSKKNWKEYKTYGWQLNTEDSDIIKQGVSISTFFDFYENSFE